MLETNAMSAGAKVLVVEDEEPLALLLRYNLEAEGYAVDVVHRGDEAEVAIAEGSPDLIVLDWMLPGLSGLELCRRLRTGKDSRHIPIILLTARSEESDRIRGLTTGADDYVVKPFSLPELMARVRAILRRTNPERIASVLSVGDIELDRESHRVSRSGAPNSSWTDRVPPARIPDAEPRPCVQPRATLGWGVGPECLRR